jgi:hypothetical protein
MPFMSVVWRRMPLFVKPIYSGTRMIRSCALLVLIILFHSDGVPDSESPVVINICALSKDLPAFNNKLVTVRGVYYYGLRQANCPQKCDTGPSLSIFNLAAAESVDWDPLDKVEQTVEAEAKKTGKRFEIWVSVTGRLQTKVIRSRRPCDSKSWFPGFGHLGAFPSPTTAICTMGLLSFSNR